MIKKTLKDLEMEIDHIGDLIDYAKSLQQEKFKGYVDGQNTKREVVYLGGIINYLLAYKNTLYEKSYI